MPKLVPIVSGTVGLAVDSVVMDQGRGSQATTASLCRSTSIRSGIFSVSEISVLRTGPRLVENQQPTYDFALQRKPGDVSNLR